MITKPDEFNIHDFSKIPPEEAYRWIVGLVIPRPIAWVTTRDEKNVINLAPFSFYNAVSSNPPCLLFCVTRKPNGEKKDTLLNIERNREFVVNVPDFDHASLVNETSAELPYGVSELDRAGLKSIPGSFTSVPRIASVKAAFECTLQQVVEIGDGTLGSASIVIGKILGAHISKGILEKGRVKAQALDPISRLGGSQWSRLGDVFDQKRPTSG